MFNFTDKISLESKKIALKRFNRTVILILMLFTLNSCFEVTEKVPECDPCISPTTYAGFRSVFVEEFNGISLGGVWKNLEGNGCPENCGFGSGELQLYQNGNVTLRDGNLILTAIKEKIGTNLYTSGRVTTVDSLSITYGRIDVRAKLPKGQGFWPAITLYGDNFREVRWPNAGQISIMQMRGGETEGRNNTIRGGLVWGDNLKTKNSFYFLSLDKGIFNDKFHVFSIIWEPNRIQWLLNDKVYSEQKIDSSMGGTFNKPFHLILNVAVGGAWPGKPDSTTIFPQEMVIDYVRVFQK